MEKKDFDSALLQILREFIKKAVTTETERKQLRPLISRKLGFLLTVRNSAGNNF